MSLLAVPALVLLLGVPVLLWLAWRRGEAVRVEVGTLLLWRDVLKAEPTRARRKRRIDVLLWIAISAAILGTAGAARPVLTGEAAEPRVAIFLERAGAEGSEPQLPDAIARARSLAPGAELDFYMPLSVRPADMPAELVMLAPGTLETELAQFEARTAYADGRILMLCRPHAPAQRIGLVAPRVMSPTAGVLFHARVQGDVVVTRAGAGPGLQTTGATLVGEANANGEVIRRYSIDAPEAAFSDSAGNTVRIVRAPFIVGVGADWSTPQHKALLNAVRPDAGDAAPDVWLGADSGAPAIRVGMGTVALPDGAEVQYEATHPLFAELPLGAFDWTRDGMMDPDARRALVAVWQGGERVGDLVTLDEVNRVLYFAADPFSEAAIVDAALLLDNAIGVVTGTRPSERSRWRIEGELPSERAAHASPFQPRGALSLGDRAGTPTEYATWILVVAACATLAGAFMLARVR